MNFTGYLFLRAKSLSLFFILSSVLLLQACGGSGGGGSEPVATYTISGTVSGLTGSSLVLQNSFTDDLDVSSNGKFSFIQKVPDTNKYTVTVLTHPSSPPQICSVKNASGIVSGADITNVSIVCETAYTISGTVSDLTGSGLVLQLNNANNLDIQVNGSFTFSNMIGDGSDYSVSVLSQPTSPDQLCSVTNPSGTIGGTNVSDISISCVNSFSVSGTVTGLNGSGLVLQNNFNESLNISSNGNFSFVDFLVNTSAYDVMVLTQPGNLSQKCSVTNANGSINNSGITNVVINCVTNVFTVGGTVSGLTSSVTLQSNGNDDITVNANGSYSFGTALDDGSNYAITVFTQPTSPIQNCIVLNSTGTLVGSNAVVDINCVEPTYSVNLRVQGLKRNGLVLQNNAADDLTINTDGKYTFSSMIANGGTYAVSISTQPSGTGAPQRCTVSNANGVINYANIIDIVVNCPPPSSVISGSTYAKPVNVIYYKYTNGIMMVWDELNGINSSKMYRYKNNLQTNWSESQTLPSTGSGLYLSSNNSIVMLVEKTSNTELRYSTFNGSWSSTTNINLPGNVNSIQDVVIDDNEYEFALVLNVLLNDMSYEALLMTYANGPSWVTQNSLTNALTSSSKALKIQYTTTDLIVTWLENQYTSSKKLYAITFNGTFWSAVTLLQDATNTNPVQSYKIVEAILGFAVVWTQPSGTSSYPYNLYSRVVNVSDSIWTSTIQLNNLPVRVYDVASNGAGFNVVWDEDIATAAFNYQYTVFSREYIFNSGWSSAASISPAFALSYNPASLQIVSNGTGYAAGWQYNTGDGAGNSNFAFYSAIHNGTIWRSASTLGTGAGFTNVKPILSLVSNGQTYAASWTDYQDKVNYNKINVYATVTSGTNNVWSAAPILLKTAPDRLDNPIFATGNNYTVLWYENDGQGKTYFTKQFTNLSWDTSSSVYLIPISQGSSLNPHIAKNNAGDMVAVWVQYDLHKWGFFMSTNKGTGWSSATKITGCENQLSSNSAYLKVISNGTNFMIFCNSSLSGAISYQDYIMAVPFDGTSLATATRLQQIYSDFTVATNGNGYAIAYQRNGTTASFKGQYINVYEPIAKTWNETMVYENKPYPGMPELSSNGVSYAMLWGESITVGQYDTMISFLDINTGLWDTRLFKTASLRSNEKLSAYDNNGYAISWPELHNLYSTYNGATWSTAVATESTVNNINKTDALLYNAGNLGVLFQDTAGALYANVKLAGSANWLIENVLTTTLGTNYGNNSTMIVNSGSEYAAIWDEGGYTDRNLYTSIFRNGVWNPKMILNSNFKDRNRSFLLDTSNGFIAAWAEPDQSNSSDNKTMRIWVTDPY